MIFEQFAVGGCQSYVIGCADTFAGALIDPEIQLVDRYRAIASREGLTLRYIIDTHTHADHFSASHKLSRLLGVPVVMHRDSPAPFVDLRLDDGSMLAIGNLRLTAMHTPGHTRDSMCLVAADRVNRSADRRPRGSIRQPLQSSAETRSGNESVSGA
jgi:glyoxylase-like metal-dependent hydrolase (beta-lactamase superfamily II)